MVYFIAAGKGSRMNSDLPKALHAIQGEPNIIRNIKMLDDDYRVVIDENDLITFSNYICLEKLITITSGLGSGHAILQLKLNDDDIIIWGDAVINDVSIIEELQKTNFKCDLVVPLKNVQNPYVNFLIDDKFHIQEVNFSKYGETSASGFQDCCIFKVSGALTSKLKELHNAIWKSRYITESSEYEFLYIIHYLFNSNVPAKGYITDFPDAIVSFNTQTELLEIENTYAKY